MMATQNEEYMEQQGQEEEEQDLATVTDSACLGWCDRLVCPTLPHFIVKGYSLSSELDEVVISEVSTHVPYEDPKATPDCTRSHHCISHPVLSVIRMLDVVLENVRQRVRVLSMKVCCFMRSGAGLRP